MARLEPEQLTLKYPAVAVDRQRATLTVTFRYAKNGEPEVRIPTHALGWPQDWRAWRGLAFQFGATSLEPFEVSFFDGTRLKAIIIEPLAGHRICAAIPFDAFFQTRTMTPLVPFGYKAWPQRLFTFGRLVGARYPFCPLGCDPSQRRRAAGFFRTEQIDGRWVLIDPHGHPFFSAGMNLVGHGQGSFATRVTGREFLYEQPPPAGPAWLTPGKDASFYVARKVSTGSNFWNGERRCDRSMVSRQV